MDYRVTLDIFDGPLDLLLHLIRRDELDVCDVSLAKVTGGFVRHVETLRELAGGVDLELAGEFVVVAATLLEIKSGELLPRAEDEREQESSPERRGEAADARLDLVRRLLDYKRLRDAADRLEARREEFSRRYARVPAFRAREQAGDEGEGLPPLALEELHAWDLLATFERLMSELGRRGPARHEVTFDDTPIDLHAADVADRVRRDGRASLRDLLSNCASRGEMVGVFLALLELVRQKRVLVRIDGGDVEISDAPDEHKALFEEASFGT